MKLTDLFQTDKFKQIVRTATDQYGKEYTLIGCYAVTMTQVLKCVVEESDGKLCVTDKKPVCSKPILPTAIYDNQDEAVQKVEVSYWNKGGTIQHKTVVNRSVLTNKNKVLQLADNGFPIGSDNAQYVANYLNSVLCAYDEQLPRRSSKSNMGWCHTDDGNMVFMPYTDALAFDGEETYRHLYNAISERGSRADWCAFMRELRSDPLGVKDADTNVPLRLVMAASFASPMVELIGENPFVVHLFAPTGQGKTVTLMVAMSIWGDPNNGKLTRSLNMTMNSMLSTTAFLNNLPFAGDELQTLKSRWNKTYDQIVMQLTEGVDRGRMNGSVLLRTKTWRNAFIFTGEDPIIKASSGGGTANRVVQIEADGKLIRNGNKTANFVKRNYGLVGREWVELLRSEPNLPELYNDIFCEIVKECDTTDKQAGAMAILLLADNLASDRFFPSERKLWIPDVERYLASVQQVDIADRAFDYVRSAIAENDAKFHKDAVIQWGSIEDEIVNINKSVLVRIMSDAGYDFDAVKKRWAADGRLESGKQGMAHYMSVGGIKAYFVKLHTTIPEKEELTDITEEQKSDLPF